MGSALGYLLATFTSANSTVVNAVSLGALWICMLISIIVFKNGSAKPQPTIAPESEVIYVDRMEQQVQEIANAKGLSEREQEIVLLFCQGRSAGRIAQELVLSENTIKTHLQNIYVKTGVHSRQELLDLLTGESE